MPKVSPEELLANKDWVRALVRGLLRDEDMIDDVVQETWLAFLQSGSEIVNPRAWLARVARSQAYRSLRGRGRSKPLSELDMAQDPAMDPSQVLESEALRDTVLKAVFELKEPFQEAVLLRYYGEIGLNEMAKRLTVPAATVRTRLYRGREELRKRLGRDDIDGSPIWAMLPLLAGPSFRAEASPGPGVDAMGASSGSAIGLGLTVGAIVLGAGALWLQAPDRTKVLAAVNSAPIEEDRRPGESTPGLIEPRGGGQARIATQTDQSAAQAAEASRTVRGTVRLGRQLWSQTDPVAAVPIHAELRRLDRDETLLQSAELLSDNRGQFQWTLPAHVEAVAILLRPAGDSFSLSLTRDVWLPGTDAPDDLTLNVFPFDYFVKGEISALGGGPIQGASLTSGGRSVFSDGYGTFQLHASSLRESSSVRATAEGYADTSVSVPAPRPGDWLDIQIELAPEWVGTGTVVDIDGKPVAGARLYGLLPGEPLTTTDELGRYRLDRASARTVFTVRAPGYWDDWHTIEQQQGPIVLRSTHEVHGIVRTPQGLPVPGARVRIARSHSEALFPETIADETGAFTLLEVPDGSRWLTVQDQTRAAHVRELEVPSADLEIVLPLGSVVEGVLVDERGRGVWPATITAEVADQRLNRRASTDSAGGFRIDGLPPSDVKLYLSGKGMETTDITLDCSEDRTGVKLALKRSGRVGGRVVDALSGDPVRQFFVRFVPSRLPTDQPDLMSDVDIWHRTFPVASDDGRWDSAQWDARLPIGQTIGYEIWTRDHAPVYVPSARVQADLDPDANVVQLETGTDLIGRIIAGDLGDPVAGAKITLASGQNGSQLETLNAFGQTITYSGADGRYRMNHVPSGSTALRVEHPAWASAITPVFKVAGGQATTERSVRVRRGGAVVATIAASDAPPAAEVVLELRSQATGLGVLRTAKVKPGDDFRFHGLASGAYDLSTRAHQGSATWYPLTKRVHVSDQETSSIRMPSAGEPKRSGEIKGPGDLPDRMILTLEPVNAPQGETLVRCEALVQDRKFQVAGLRSGTYHATLRDANPGSGGGVLGQQVVVVGSDASERLSIHPE